MALRAGFIPNTVYNRLARGETLEQAFSRPARRYRVVSTAVLACLEGTPNLSALEIAERIGEPRETVREALLRFWRQELVVVSTRPERVGRQVTLVRRYRLNTEPTAEEWTA